MLKEDPQLLLMFLLQHLRIRSLLMSRNQLGLSTVDALSALLCGGVLKRLDLDHNPLHSEAFIKLMEAVSYDTSSVTHLSLNSIFSPSSNSSAYLFAAPTALAIRDTLQRNGVLEDLGLGK